MNSLSYTDNCLNAHFLHHCELLKTELCFLEAINMIFLNKIWVPQRHSSIFRAYVIVQCLPLIRVNKLKGKENRLNQQECEVRHLNMKCFQ